MSVSISLESCVKSLSLQSGCQKCADVCGENALSFRDGLVVVDALNCTECQACVAVCPTEAIALDKKSLHGMSVDELFCEVVQKGGDISFDVTSELFAACMERADEANALLAAFGISSRILPLKSNDKAKKVEDGSKRALFRMFTKEGIKASHDALKSGGELAGEIDYSLLKSKKVPSKRERFLDAVKSLEIAEDVEVTISFASDKYIDDSCDNCSLCYNLCPSGALETTAMKNAILFSPHLCLKCKLCEDVCESKSIFSLPVFSLIHFKEQKKRVLKKFLAKLCQTCGTVFSGDGEECPRCSKESEDAYELLGL